MTFYDCYGNNVKLKKMLITFAWNLPEKKIISRVYTIFALIFISINKMSILSEKYFTMSEINFLRK